MLNYTLDVVPKMQSESAFSPSSNVRCELMLMTNTFQRVQTPKFSAGKQSLLIFY